MYPRTEGGRVVFIDHCASMAIVNEALWTLQQQHVK